MAEPLIAPPARPLSLPYAEVAVLRQPLEPLTYSVPAELDEGVTPGRLVHVRMGARMHVGVVVRRTDVLPPKISLRPIRDVIEHAPSLRAELLDLAQWMADWYLCPLGEVFPAMLAPQVEARGSGRLALTASGRERVNAGSTGALGPIARQIVAWLAERPYTRREITAAIAREITNASALGEPTLSLRALRLGDWVAPEHPEASAPRNPHGPTYRVVESALTDEVLAKLRSRAPMQLEALDTLREMGGSGPRDVLTAELLIKSATLETLRAKGLLMREDSPAEDPSGRHAMADAHVHHPLTPAQTSVYERVLAHLNAPSFAPFLLYGVTGSGKTQVYLEWVDRVLAQGRTALVLVPEIALTPQLSGRFRSRFGDVVTIWHSGLSEVERVQSYARIASGEVRVVVGVRSAVFAPLPDLALIVVDEEHDTSYKQDTPSPCYHARDVAVTRASGLGIPIVLGSATPSLETWFNALEGRYTRLDLPERIADRPLPSVEIVDTTARASGGGGRGRPSSLPERLITELLARSARAESTIVFLNRRGYAPYLACDACGWSAGCPNCSVTLTYHRGGASCRCHLCGYAMGAPVLCPECGAPDLRTEGMGTERVERDLRACIGATPLVRMDADTTRGRGAHRKLLEEFHGHPGSVLVGTQMVTKGLDFAEVTLVAVLQAESGLLMPDFRAGEHTFAQLTQVAGRSGRGERAGDVLVFTSRADDPAILSAARHDYLGFVVTELTSRRETHFPPYTRLIRIVASDVAPERPRDVLVALAMQLRDELVGLEGCTVEPPEPCILEKLRGRYRHSLLLKLPRGGPARRRIAPTLRAIAGERDRTLRVSVNVDPIDML